MKFLKRSKILILSVAAIASLALSTFGGVMTPHHAYAAGETYTFKDANTITGSGGDFPQAITFKLNNGSYTGTFSLSSGRVTVSRSWTIGSVTKSADKLYTGVISTSGSATQGQNIKGNISINDPNSVGPGATPTPAAGGTTATTDDEEKPVCEVSTDPLTWGLCPVFNGLANLSDWILLNIVVPFMRPSPVGLDPNDKATGSVYQIWSDMRVIADIILVMLVIIAVISQAYGGGIVETYTARKMLPRILIGAILINISIYIVAFAIDMSNVIGAGIGDLITAPLVQTGNNKFTPDGLGAFMLSAGISTTMAGIVTYLAGSGTFLTFLPWLLVIIVLPIALAMIGIVVTLILLQALYMVLTIFCPVAFALWAFPNTEKYFHSWWDWLFRALLVYPIFMTLVALSDVFTVLIQKANS